MSMDFCESVLDQLRDTMEFVEIKYMEQQLIYDLEGRRKKESKKSQKNLGID